MSIANLSRSWCRFWFEADADVRDQRLRIFRTLFAGTLFVFYLIRALDLELFYGESGLLSLESYEAVMKAPFRYSVLAFFPGKNALWAMQAMMSISLLSLTLGILPRLSALVAWICQVSFLHRNYPAHFGADFISTFFIFYLVLASPTFSQPIWTSLPSLASLKRRWGSTFLEIESQLASVGYRMMQIQLCVIYFYSGVEKLKGTSWWAGDALWLVLANPQLARFEFSFIEYFPTFLVVMTYATLLWEIFFSALIWIPRLRGFVLFFGLGMHVMIGFTVQLPFFSLIMISVYVLFWDIPKVGDWQKMVRRIRVGISRVTVSART